MNRFKLIVATVLILTIALMVQATNNFKAELQDKLNAIVSIDSVGIVDQAVWLYFNISTTDSSLQRFRVETKNAKSYYDIMIVINGKEYAMSLDEFIRRLDKGE